MQQLAVTATAGKLAQGKSLTEDAPK